MIILPLLCKAFCLLGPFAVDKTIDLTKQVLLYNIFWRLLPMIDLLFWEFEHFIEHIDEVRYEVVILFYK